LLNSNGEPNILAAINDKSSKNILWITALDIGLVKLDIKTDSCTIYSEPGSSDFLTWILPYPGKTDWLLLGANSLLSFNKITGKFEELLQIKQSTEIPNNLINDAVIDPTDNKVIWLATGDIWGRGKYGGLISYNLESGKQELFSTKNRKGEIPDMHILQVCFYDEDKLWVGTRNSGVLLYKTKEDRFYNYFENEYDKGSFTTVNAVRSMLLDKSGTMWFGTWGDGISILSPTAQKFSHYMHLPDIKTGLPDNYITAISEDAEQNIWIGTRVGGLSKFNPDQKTFENYFQDFVSSPGGPIEITSLFYDSRDNLWIGTYANALYRYTPETGVRKHYQEGASDRNVTQKRISAINELNPGEILISTYGGGLNIYNYETDHFKHFKNNPEDSTSIPDNQIWHPFRGRDGKYYFGGNSVAGLIQFDPESETFNNISPSNTVSPFMSSVETKDGRVFIDDVSEGLRELSIQDEITINTVYDINGDNITNVESILIDGGDRLWLGTGNGLLEYDPDNKKVIRYSTNDGLQGYEFTRFAAYRSSSGVMYFGGKNGFNVFHPDEIKPSEYKAPVVFTDFSLFQQSVEIGEDSPVKMSLSLMDELVLDHYQNDFSLSFAALDFSNPKRIEYKYILENHDEEWKSAGNNGQASYTNMDPGKYTLKVMATNGDGVWNEEAKSVRIIIHPPWWLTTWAYLIYGLIFIAGIFIIDRLQRKRLKEKQRAETREKELAQAKEIEKAYTTLKATQAQLIHAEKMASIGELTAGIAHEIQNPLNFINNFAEVNTELIVDLNEEIDNGDLKEIKTIALDIASNEKKIIHHGKRADGIVKGMLQHSRISGDEMVPTNINAMADEILRLSFHGMRAKDNSFSADYQADLDENLTRISVIPQDFGRVLLNLINNAFYAVSSESEKRKEADYEPQVMVTTKKLDDVAEIRIKDNGCGIPEGVREKIFQPFFTTKPTGEGTGLGLSLSYEIITKGHGGKLSVISKEGEGSEFIIRLPAE